MTTKIDNISDTSNTASTMTAPVSGGTGASAGAPQGDAKPAIGFLARVDNASLMVTIAAILKGTANNPAFPTPDPALADVIAARDAFAAAITAARDSKIALTVRDQYRVNVVKLLRKLAQYVQVASAGDLPTLLSSGFPAQRRRAPVGPLPAPEGIRLVRGTLSGQVTARCRKNAKAYAYQWRCAPAATPGAWLPVATTNAAHCVFQGLAPGVAYVAQACVLGTAGPSNWSEVASVVVL